MSGDQVDDDSIEARFADLENLSGGLKKGTISPQRRGQLFEKVVADLLDLEGLEARTSFRPSGEEVDGSFVLGDRVFLLELKWRAKPIPASDLYAFKGKVDGKLVGTLGVFVSMSGFADDAADALSMGKELNIVLFDRLDFDRVIEGETTFSEAVRYKLRYAAERGKPFAPLAAIPSTIPSTVKPINVVVETADAALALQTLLERSEPKTEAAIQFWPAEGALNTASLAAELTRAQDDPAVVVLDGDVLAEANASLREDLARFEIIVFEPTLRSVLDKHMDPEYDLHLPPTSSPGKEMRRFGRHVNVKSLADSSEAFRQLLALHRARAAGEWRG
ncbi:restriction endonuclease [Curtobacterium flaccumfaciens pv. flaccumfaciens]|uniref:restriction endonuclease n=1 Tax=Curtobacterium flaccumfaciens TaxID=2035 RepID=UPI00217CD99B|nr:restriction endonuclease [Curtobacterium flaccumfaciens]MCS6550474.1 restriction endonuclease [Curtobacterium flaccumfaciens pv. flaccumfaciens]